MPGCLAVVGDLVEDVVVWPEGPVQPGSDTPAQVFRSRGGSAANGAAAAAPYVPARFLGCVGADASGDRLVAELRAAGVDVRAQRRGRTGTVVVVVDAFGERTFFPDRVAAADLDVLGPGALDGVSLLHVPAYGLLGGRTPTALHALLVLAGTRKVAERDLAVAAAQSWDVGVTTVSASVALAARVGISVFATGGIGGVHRGVELSGDVSADLDALASHPVVTVCAGAKSFLDLARTLELLETSGVPVLGWRSPDFPAFYVRSSGLPVPHVVQTAEEVARVLRFRSRPQTGVLLTVPIPEADELDPARHDAALSTALEEVAAAGITGAAVTPYVLNRVSMATEGGSVPANLALAENNAGVAAQVAAALAAVPA